MSAGDYVLSLRLPFPVPVNGLFRNATSRDGSYAHGRRRIPTERYRAWSEHAGLQLNVQLAGLHKPVYSGPVAMEILLGRPDKRRRDLDGCAKALLDRLTGFAYLDDSQVVDLRLKWAAVDGAHITIRPANP